MTSWYFFLNRTQIFADPPAMRGTSGQVYADNVIIFLFKYLVNLCLPYEMHFLFLFHRGDLCPKQEIPIRLNGFVLNHSEMVTYVVSK